MNCSSVSSVQTPPRQRVLAAVLTVAVLASVLAAPIMSVASAQAANATNTTPSANTSSPATPSASGTPTPTTNGGQNATRPTNGSQNATQPANATNTSARAGGNTSRLSSGSATGASGSGSGSTSLTGWVKDLAGMNKSQAKQAVKNNPQKADRLAKALGRLGVQNPNQTVQQRPRQAARKMAGVLSAGNPSANVTQNNSSAGGSQVKLRKCTGGGFIGNAMCKASNVLFGWIIGGVVDFVQGIISGIVNLIVGTPVPKHNGSPAFFQQPTNQPWKGVYNSWLTFALPLGIIEWMLMMLGIMFSQVYISGSANELKRREMKNRSWKVLFGVLGSWVIGATILHLSNAVTLAVAPNGKDIASNLAVFVGSVGAAGAAGLLIWFFEGILFLFILLLVLSKYAVVFVMMWSLPVLLPLAAFNVGPLKLLSKPARGIIDMFIPFVFLTLPMALVLRVGYVVVNSLNQGAIAQIGMWASGANTALILGFWIVAAVSPLFVFSQTGRIKGMAAGMLGASLATSNVQEKVQDAKNHVTSNGQLNEKTDINAGKNEGTHGGPLPGGDGSDKPSMLEAGRSEQKGADSTTSTTNGPELPGPGGGGIGADAGAGSTSDRTTSTTNGAGSGSESATASGSDAVAENVVSSEDITEVQQPDDLPDDTKYRVGRIKDNDEFQPLPDNPNYTPSGLANNYNRLNTSRHYEDENLLLQSKDDGSFYDLDSTTYREQSYEQMSRDTSEDVLNS
jgi:hypothetical protein